MAKLRFDATASAELLAHAEEAPTHRGTFGQLVEAHKQAAKVELRKLWTRIGRTFTEEELDAIAEENGERHAGSGKDEDLPDYPPGLLVVKDQGIYLMSNGLPHLAREDEPDSSKVCYAQGGFTPNGNDQCWDNCRNAVGGDDFAEAINAESLRKIGLGELDAQAIEIEITEETISFRLVRQRAGSRNHG